MVIGKKVGGDAVDAQLKKLEQNFDIANPLASKISATMLGHALARVALDSVASFKAADKRLTTIVERLIGNEMGAVAGAVERGFHGGVGAEAHSDEILRANNASKKERGGSRA